MSFVYNQDVRGLHSRMNRFITEMLHSQSANLSEVNAFDQTRLTTYLDAIETYHDWVTNQPDLDLPETSPRQYTLDTDPSVPVMENESIRDVIELIQLARDELTNSQSARKPAGMVSFDSIRLMAVVNKVRAFLNDYISTTTPLDLPESSPMREVTEPGKVGV